MHKHPAKIPLLAFLAAFIMSPALPACVRSHERARQVDALLKKYDRPDSPGAAIVVVQDGKTILQREYGSANLEYGFPITSKTVFHVGSVGLTPKIRTTLSAKN